MAERPRKRRRLADAVHVSQPRSNTMQLVPGREFPLVLQLRVLSWIDPMDMENFALTSRAMLNLFVRYVQQLRSASTMGSMAGVIAKHCCQLEKLDLVDGDRTLTTVRACSDLIRRNANTLTQFVVDEIKLPSEWLEAASTCKLIERVNFCCIGSGDMKAWMVAVQNWPRLRHLSMLDPDDRGSVDKEVAVALQVRGAHLETLEATIDVKSACRLAAQIHDMPQLTLLHLDIILEEEADTAIHLGNMAHKRLTSLIIRDEVTELSVTGQLDLPALTELSLSCTMDSIDAISVPNLQTLWMRTRERADDSCIFAAVVAARRLRSLFLDVETNEHPTLCGAHWPELTDFEVTCPKLSCATLAGMCKIDLPHLTECRMQLVGDSHCACINDLPTFLARNPQLTELEVGGDATSQHPKGGYHVENKVVRLAELRTCSLGHGISGSLLMRLKVPVATHVDLDNVADSDAIRTSLESFFESATSMSTLKLSHVPMEKMPRFVTGSSMPGALKHLRLTGGEWTTRTAVAFMSHCPSVTHLFIQHIGDLLEFPIAVTEQMEPKLLPLLRDVTFEASEKKLSFTDVHLLIKYWPELTSLVAHMSLEHEQALRTKFLTDNPRELEGLIMVKLPGRLRAIQVRTRGMWHRMSEK